MLKQLWTRQHLSLVGADLRGPTLRLMQLSCQADCVTVTWQKEVCISVVNPAASENIEWIPHLSDCRQSFLGAGPPTAIALKSSQVFMKRITFCPQTRALDEETRVWLEAEKHLPYPMAEVFLDYVLQKDEPGALMVAARRLDVNAYWDALKQAGFRLRVVDVDTYAILRVLKWLKVSHSPTRDTGAIAVVDVTAQGFVLHVFYQDHSIYVREHHVTVSNPPATFYSHQPFLGEATLSDTTTCWVTEIARACDAYRAKSGALGLTALFIIGDAPVSETLAALLEARLRCEVSFLSPFERVRFSKADAEDSVSLWPGRWVVPLGLALRQGA